MSALHIFIWAPGAGYSHGAARLPASASLQLPPKIRRDAQPIASAGRVVAAGAKTKVGFPKSTEDGLKKVGWAPARPRVEAHVGYAHGTFLIIL